MMNNCINAKCLHEFEKSSDIQVDMGFATITQKRCPKCFMAVDTDIKHTGTIKIDLEKNKVSVKKN